MVDAMAEVTERSRLRWQCRRGMRELDVLMTRWLERDWALASSAERAAFQQLLALQDPQLAEYLLRGEPHPDQVTVGVIDRMLQC
jgi:antitoxin CptB